MSVLPVELRNSAQGERWAVELDRSLEAARTALARRKTLIFACATLWLAILLSCAWVVLVRFTLLDVPQWPALVFPVGWLLGLVLIRRTRKVGVGESARYLDRSLDLDERVATSLEIVRSAPVMGLKPVTWRVPRAMLADTAFHLQSKRGMLSSGLNYGLRRWQWYALGASLVLLSGAIFLPTPLDQVRAERAQLERAVNEQIANVEQLRAELIDRPGLDADSKAKIDQELERLLGVLTTPQTDRSAMLAAIADTQERLHGLSPLAPSDFLGVVAAAKTMQNAAVAAGRNSNIELADDNVWSPDALPNLSDLGKAADAARTVKNWVKDLNSIQLRALTSSLERAETQAEPENAELAQDLLNASEAVSIKDVEKSTTSLQAVSDGFLAADKKWQLAGAVEKALADLDDGRQTLAKAGANDVRKGQVGFRRPGALTSDPANNTAGTPAATGQGASGNQAETDDGEHGVSKNGPSAFGQNMGSNSPDFSSLGNGQSADGTSGTGGGGGVSSNDATSDGQQANGGQSGGTAGGGTGNSPGTFGGQSTGVVGGSGGAISQVKNPQGQGVSTTSDPSNTGESVYIPPTEEPQTDGGRSGSDIGTAPAGTPSGDGREGGLEGRAGQNDGTTQTIEQRGVGAINEIRTPYKEVYGDYAKQAGQALEGVYIPADAKDYVKEYFTELGK